MTTDRERLEAAIAALEAQRSSLGDAVVDAGVASLREKLVSLAKAGADQRKQVTVLFADVSGFTAMSETMDAEDVRDVMNALWQRLDGVITAHGGLVDKHIGDAVMALFGVPRATEHDAESAVRAALAMQRELRRFDAGHRHLVRGQAPPALAMRIGIHTGPVILGAVGTTSEYTAIGDTVNLASRLEGLAPVGGILVSQATHSLVRGLFQAAAREPVTVKGKAEAVVSFQIEGVVAPAFRDPRRGRDGAPTPLVGRRRELGRVRAVVADAVASESFRGLLLVGDAGVGKSRLLHELHDEVVAADLGPAMLKGRGEASASGEAYYLMGQALKDHWDLHAPDEAAADRERIARAFDAVLGDPGAAVHVHALVGLLEEPAVAAVGDPPDRARRQRERAWDTLRRYVVALARTRGGCVLLLEDLHWADAASLDLIGYLAARCASDPVAVLATARPRFLRHPSHQLPDVFERLDLRPLDRDDAAALARALLGDAEAASSLRGELVDKGEGNPFFLEELARAAEADGMPAAPLPASLTSLLQARLEALPPDAVSATQAAAVVGRTFWAAAVTRLAESKADAGEGAGTDPTADEGRWLAALDEASAHGIVRREVTTSIAGHAEFAFRHALLHEVAYESVLRRARRRLHLAAAHWILAAVREGRRPAALLAHHFDLGHAPEEAARWHAVAGGEAFAAYANDEAVQHYQRALELVVPREAEDRDALQARFDLAVALEATLHRLGRRARQGTVLADLEAWAADLGPAAAATARLRRASLAWAVGDLEAARLAALEGRQAAEEAGDGLLVAEADRQLGRLAREMGEPDEAATRLAAAASAFAAAGHTSRHANTVIQIGVLHSEQGALDEAQTRLQEGHALAVAAGDDWDQAWALDNLSIVSFLQGDWGRALSTGRESLTLAEATGGAFRQVQNRVNLGLVLVKLGLFGDAIDMAVAGARLADTIDDGYGAVLARVVVAEGQRGLGQLTASLATAEEALRGAQDLQRGELVATARWARALGRLDSGQPAAAVQDAAIAVADADAAGDPGAAILAQVALARGLLALSRTDEALAAAQAAVRRMKDAGGAEGAEDRVYYTLFEAEGAAGHADAADEALAQAAAALTAKADAVSDSHLRQSLLKNLPLSRAIMAGMA